MKSQENSVLYKNLNIGQMSVKMPRIGIDVVEHNFRRIRGGGYIIINK